jgi:polyisoprenoid-binding protein YceI
MRFNPIYKLIICLMFFAFSKKTCAQETNWTVTNKNVTFTIKNAKLPVSGSFEGLMAKVVFNPNNLKAASFSAAILVSTIKTGIEMRDKHLKRSEYFNVEKFPEITLTSNSITLVKGNEYNAKCNLTIKSLTKEVDLPFTFIESDNSAVFKGILNLNRLDYGVGSSSVIMSNTLQVSIIVNAIKK